MPSPESDGTPPPTPENDVTFGLPAAILSVLPSDPYEQLDVARKIISIALANRVNSLDAEAAGLRASLADRDGELSELRDRLQNLEVSLADVAQLLARARDEKETLLNEKKTLTGTVNKLSRDVAKLEAFKNTLMQSLQGEVGSSPVATARVAPGVRETSSLSTGSASEDEQPESPTKHSLQSQPSETGSVITEDGGYDRTEGLKLGRSHSVLVSYTSSPGLTPSDSPHRLSARGSAKRSSAPVSPRRRARNMLDEKSSTFSSLPSSRHSSISSPHNMTTQSGRTRVDGKEFFHQVRSRLSYEQFGAFLANVKELNAHKQTKEETLQKADKIFGSENEDLFNIFEGLISRNLQ